DICKPESDPDNDKLTNAQEFYYHSSPLNAHTIGDKLSDGELVASNIDPSKTGHQSFDQVASDDSVLGESIVFDTDIKNMIADLTQIKNAQIPEINPNLIKISKT